MSLYLDLMERVLTGMAWDDPPLPVPWLPDTQYRPEWRSGGIDWPSRATSMLGMLKLRNLRELTEQALRDGIPGDLAECGVWRGGACILIRAILAEHGVTDRTVWVIDSFRGLPPHDECGQCGTCGPEQAALAVTRPEVEENFARLGLLDQQVQFVEGWFADSLPGPVGELAVLRADGDRYESQRDVLAALYPKVSPGGFIIIDDYHFPECRKAVDEYRTVHGITAPVHEIPFAAWWRKDA